MVERTLLKSWNDVFPLRWSLKVHTNCSLAKIFKKSICIHKKETISLPPVNIEPTNKETNQANKQIRQTRHKKKD